MDFNNENNVKESTQDQTVTISKELLQSLLDMASQHCADYKESMPDEPGYLVSTYVDQMEYTLSRFERIGLKPTGC